MNEDDKRFVRFMVEYQAQQPSRLYEEEKSEEFLMILDEEKKDDLRFLIKYQNGEKNER
ncbi:MAG: hypothetical protein ABIF40_03330 [archaeon]